MTRTAILALACLVGVACAGVQHPRWSKDFREEYTGKVGYMLTLAGAGDSAEPLAECFASEMEQGVSEERLKTLQGDAQPTPEEQALTSRVIQKCLCERVKPAWAFEEGGRCTPK